MGLKVLHLLTWDKVFNLLTWDRRYSICWCETDKLTIQLIDAGQTLFLFLMWDRWYSVCWCGTDGIPSSRKVDYHCGPDGEEVPAASHQVAHIQGCDLIPWITIMYKILNNMAQVDFGRLHKTQEPKVRAPAKRDRRAHSNQLARVQCLRNYRRRSLTRTGMTRCPKLLLEPRLLTFSRQEFASSTCRPRLFVCVCVCVCVCANPPLPVSE